MIESGDGGGRKRHPFLRVIEGSKGKEVNESISSGKLSDIADRIKAECETDVSSGTKEFSDAVLRQQDYVEKFKDEEIARLLNSVSEGSLLLNAPYRYALACEWLKRYPMAASE